MRTQKLATWERQSVAPFFTRQAEIDTSLAPFLSMRRNPTTSGAMVRNEVRQFVLERPLDLVLAELPNARVQHNQCRPRKGHARGAPHPSIPADFEPRRDCCAADRTEPCPGAFAQRADVVFAGIVTRSAAI